jgi:hypothetical protein
MSFERRFGRFLGQNLIAAVSFTLKILEPIGNIPPTEAEARYYAQLEERSVAA